METYHYIVSAFWTDNIFPFSMMSKMASTKNIAKVVNNKIFVDSSTTFWCVIQVFFDNQIQFY